MGIAEGEHPSSVTTPMLSRKRSRAIDARELEGPRHCPGPPSIDVYRVSGFDLDRNPSSGTNRSRSKSQGCSGGSQNNRHESHTKSSSPHDHNQVPPNATQDRDAGAKSTSPHGEPGIGRAEERATWIPSEPLLAHSQMTSHVSKTATRLRCANSKSITVEWKLLEKVLLIMFDQTAVAVSKFPIPPPPKKAPANFTTNEAQECDGYRWRKYGQKLLVGSQMYREYLRCTHPGCPAKKHVEVVPGTGAVKRLSSTEHNHPAVLPAKQDGRLDSGRTADSPREQKQLRKQQKQHQQQKPERAKSPKSSSTQSESCA